MRIMVAMKQTFLLAGVIASLFIAGCTQPAAEPTVESEKPAAASTTGAEPVAFRNKEGKLVCPMMGAEIKDEASAVGHVDYEGVRYYLCCDMCKEPAEKDPKALAEKAKKLN